MAFLNYEQKEIYIQEYLIKNKFQNLKLPGITFIIPNQSKLIEKIKKIIGNEEYDTFIKLAQINEDFKILNFAKLKEFNPKYHRPELNNYIILITQNKQKYFMDYVKRQKINLFNENEELFDEFSLYSSEVYLVSYIAKQLSLEIN